MAYEDHPYFARQLSHQRSPDRGSLEEATGGLSLSPHLGDQQAQRQELSQGPSPFSNPVSPGWVPTGALEPAQPPSERSDRPASAPVPAEDRPGAARYSLRSRKVSYHLLHTTSRSQILKLAVILCTDSVVCFRKVQLTRAVYTSFKHGCA